MTRQESRKVQVSMGAGAERAEQKTAEGDAEYVRRSLNASDHPDTTCMASFSHAETRSFRHSDPFRPSSNSFAHRIGAVQRSPEYARDLQTVSRFKAA